MSLLHADVVVVGSELCGFAAAALLAHAGRRVVVLDNDEQVESRPLGGRLVPTVPTLWRVPPSGPASTLIDQLGLRQRARHELGDPEGLGLIDDPDLRMIVPVEPAARARELRRVFGDDGERLAELLEAFPTGAHDCLFDEAALLHEDGFFAQLKAKKRIESYGAAGRPDEDDPSVLALGDKGLGAALPHLVPFVQTRAAPAARGVARWLAAWQLAGGTVANTRAGVGLRSALRELFADVVRGHGGEVLEGRRALELEVEGKRIARVRTDGPNHYAARAVIDATVRRNLSERLPPSRRTERTRALESTVRLVGGAAVVRWLLPRAVLPRGMPSRAVVLPTDGLEAPALLGVFQDLPAVEKKRKVDPRLVAVVIACRCEEGEDARLTDALAQRLDALMPFARRFVEAEDHITGEDARLALPAFRADEAPHLLGGRRPVTGYANLLRAGRELVPALGIEGELAAARSVAAAVTRSLGKGARAESALGYNADRLR